ncbi:hypothetical protein [Pelotalea chapellei]|uniref:Motility protein YjfB-like n=1 Tax=Pelotalea chapellei TaxID=44671 RepID=A0ABS5U5V9_9BACT|nr:hypothetical protein [Pelotalea chapellei]MBT1071051.1 hypothetical protein [Pelotalea chapellei]
MDTVSIAGAAQLMKTAQTQQVLSTTLMKQAAEQQNQIVNILAQNAQQTPQPAADSNYNFSTYA